MYAAKFGSGLISVEEGKDFRIAPRASEDTQPVWQLINFLCSEKLSDLSGSGFPDLKRSELSCRERVRFGHPKSVWPGGYRSQQQSYEWHVTSARV